MLTVHFDNLTGPGLDLILTLFNEIYWSILQLKK